MKNDTVTVFLGGDVFGAAGMAAATALLPSLIAEYSIDFTVINGENATAGTGISPQDAAALFACGVDVITGGNHSFEKREFIPLLETDPRVLRPANYPHPCGRGDFEIEKNGIHWAVLNLQGREFMPALDCPFRLARARIDEWNAQAEPPLVLVDFHAESNEEKEALAFYLDGDISVLAGTHTHVQTADERVLPAGTAYQTDLGMTGPVLSVIGVDPVLAVKRNITQVLYRMEPAAGQVCLRGLVVSIDTTTRCALSVERIMRRL